VSQYLIGNLTPGLWLVNPPIGWLSPTDVLGDALRDLRCSKNALSAYEIEDGASTAHIKRVAAAIAAAFKTEPVDTEYRLIQSAAIRSLDISIEITEGTLGDDEINPLHRDLVRLSAEKLGRLAGVIAHSPLGHLSAKEFEQILKREIGRNALRVNARLMESLGLSRK
jgi:hypothetical protein